MHNIYTYILSTCVWTLLPYSYLCAGGARADAPSTAGSVRRVQSPISDHMRRSPLFTALLTLPCHAVGSSPPGGFLHAGVNGQWIDELGRVRILHGSNRVEKRPPWYFAEMAGGDEEFRLMQKMGFTVIRLGFMWSGANPAPGVFNATYIDIIRGIVDRAAEHGIYTLLDMHEDVLSSKFCLYDGAPLWVVNKSVPAHPFPWPLSGDCGSRGWEMNAVTEAAATAFQDLYDNTNGMLDDLGDFWAHAAQAFAGAAGVIGYEIINEPFAGNFYADPTVLLPGVAGLRNLQPMYDTVARRIREHDKRHVIFYEPVTWGMIFDSEGAVGSGFSHVPGGSSYANRSAFSYHYYCNTFVPSYASKPTLRKVVCDDTVAPLVLKAVQHETARLGGSAMMTEGLACDYSQATSADECRAVMDDLDAHLFSWTDYGVSQGSTWAPSAAQQEGWARTHAYAIAGTPLNMTFDAATKAFAFCFTVDHAIDAPTEIFASLTYSYAAGRAVSTTPNLRVDAPAGDDVVLVRPADARMLMGMEDRDAVGCVQIRRA